MTIAKASDSPTSQQEKLLDFIEERLDGPLADPIKALEVQFQAALRELKEYLLGHVDSRRSSERAQRLTRRIARHFLFDYYIGFSMLKFRPAYGRSTSVTARQRDMEEALGDLSALLPARDLMVEYFTAALEQRLHKLMREFLDAHRFTINPRDAVLHRAVRIGMADDWEKLGRHGQTLYQVMPFGLSGFYLLFQRTGVARPSEFEALMNYALRLAQGCHWAGITEVVSILCTAHLSIEQQDQLLTWVQSLLDLDQFPYIDPYVEMNPDASMEAMGLSPGLTRLLKWVARRYERQLREDARLSMDIRQRMHPHPDQEDLAWRRSEVAHMLSLLAAQSDQALFMLPQYEQTRYSVETLLPMAMKKLSVLKVLMKCMEGEEGSYLSSPSETAMKALQESNHTLDRDCTEFLFNCIREQGKYEIWARQVLQNIPSISEFTVDWLMNMLRSEDNPAVLRVLIQMHFSLKQRKRTISPSLEAALFIRLKNLMLDSEVTLQPDWIIWTVGMGRTYLLRLLGQISDLLEHQPTASVTQRCGEILHTFATVVNRVPYLQSFDLYGYRTETPSNGKDEENSQAIDAVTIAACWLVDTDDWLQEGKALYERVLESCRLLKMSDTNRVVQQRVANILNAAITSKPDSHLIIAHALGMMRYPELALPDLEHLMKVSASGDRYEQKPDVYAAALKSVASLTPLTTEVMRILEEGVVRARDSDARLHATVTPSFVYEKLLPLLAHEVAPEAGATLIELVWRRHCMLCGMDSPSEIYKHRAWWRIVDEKVHRYLHIAHEEGYYTDGLVLLCALQSLANLTNLTGEQQRIVWRVYRTSWSALIKALCLLVLGRQRPVQEKTVQELVSLLHQSATAASFRTFTQHLFQALLLRLFVRTSAPDPDLNYALLCQGIAVNIIGTWLQLSRDDLCIRKNKPRLAKALLTTTSFFRYGLEPHENSFLSSGSGSSGTQGIMRILGASAGEAAFSKASWVAYPADRAYEVLLDLIRTRALTVFEDTDTQTFRSVLLTKMGAFKKGLKNR